MKLTVSAITNLDQNPLILINPADDNDFGVDVNIQVIIKGVPIEVDDTETAAKIVASYLRHIRKGTH